MRAAKIVLLEDGFENFKFDLHERVRVLLKYGDKQGSEIKWDGD